MEVYIIFTLILFLFSFYEIFYNDKNTKRLLLFLSFLGSVFIIGGRWETGTDWYPYKLSFENNQSFDSFLQDWTAELGYATLSWVVKLFSDDYSVFLIIHATIFYGLLLKAFSKLTIYPQVAFSFYFSSSLGIVGSNRQLISLVIILNGLVFLLEKKRVKYFIYLVSALLFHATSFLAGVYYFLNRNISSFWVLTLIFMAFLFGISPLPLKLFGSVGVLGIHFATKTEAYLQSANEIQGLTLLGIFKRLFLFFIFFYVRSKMINCDRNYNLLFNGYFVGLLVYLVFATSLAVMISRGSLYFNIMEGLLFSYVFFVVKQPFNKVVYMFFLITLSIILMYQSIALYPEIFDPYKGLWYNQDYYRMNL